jgi:hypothetical protein
MVMLAAFVLAATASQGSRPAPVVAQATASVRIVSGVKLKFDAPANPGAPPARARTIMLDGKAQQARIIDFE